MTFEDWLRDVVYQHHAAMQASHGERQILMHEFMTECVPLLVERLWWCTGALRSAEDTYKKLRDITQGESSWKTVKQPSRKTPSGHILRKVKG